LSSLYNSKADKITTVMELNAVPTEMDAEILKPRDFRKRITAYEVGRIWQNLLRNIQRAYDLDSSLLGR
jgi:hypothetical protein